MSILTATNCLLRWTRSAGSENSFRCSTRARRSRQQPRDPFVRAVPMVRIRFPPAVSPPQHLPSTPTRSTRSLHGSRPIASRTPAPSKIPGRDRGFESRFLQGRVCKLSVPHPPERCCRGFCALLVHPARPSAPRARRRRDCRFRPNAERSPGESESDKSLRETEPDEPPSLRLQSGFTTTVQERAR